MAWGLFVCSSKGSVQAVAARRAARRWPWVRHAQRPPIPTARGVNAPDGAVAVTVAAASVQPAVATLAASLAAAVAILVVACALGDAGVGSVPRRLLLSTGVAGGLGDRGPAAADTTQV
jgi:hypothetical protein